MKFQTVLMRMDSGENSTKERLSFDNQGQVVRAVAWLQNDPTHPVYLKIEADTGQTLVEETNIKDYIQRNGGDYLTSKKPVSFSTQKITIKASANHSLSVDFFFEVMLIIDEKK